MRRETALVLVAACVVLAGCAGGGSDGVPNDLRTTDNDTATKTLPDPLYQLELRNRNDSPVRVTVELTSPDNETTYYETTTTLGPDSLRDYTPRVRDIDRFRATVTVANASVTRVVGPEEGYSVWVQNRTAIAVHELPD